MKAVLNKKENNKVSFNIELDEKQFEDAVQKSYLQNRSRINIPGFRKGKAPRKIIEMNYGRDFFYEEAINMVLPEAYDSAIEELDLEPVDRPEIDIETIEKGKPIIITVEVDVKPEVKLGDYKSIELEKIEYNVTDEMIDNELRLVQEQNGRIIDAGDREIKDGDILTIDFAGYLDEEQFEGGTAEGYELEIGSGSFIPGFEEQLVGKKKDEEVEVNVTFPEEYQEESLAGKEVVFKVTIHEIKEKELPKLDDELAKDVSEFDTLDEYKASIREKLEEEAKNREKVEKENKTIEKIVELSEFEIPEGMIESQLETEVQEFNHRLQSQGLEFEQYLTITGSTVEDLKVQLRPAAEKRVAIDLVLEAIGKTENIEVTDEDIDAELNKIADMYEQEDKEEFIETIKKGNLDFLTVGITNQKVVKLLMDNVKFN